MRCAGQAGERGVIRKRGLADEIEFCRRCQSHYRVSKNRTDSAIEKKIHRLSFIPVIGGLILLLYCIWFLWSGINTLSSAHLILVAFL
jgi:hypothetical protein